MTLVAPIFTFPNISWWMQVLKADSLLLDPHEPFRKMTWRNRYQIAGANNSILLTVPLQKGRNQRALMSELNIFNIEKWQTQHWRTLVSVYKRSPFFDHYEPSLMPLFETTFTTLVDFNLAGIMWAVKQLKLKTEVTQTTGFVPEYPADVIDIRNTKNIEDPPPRYYQIFEDRIGFQPNLSILDLLFSEGPAAGRILLANK